MTHTTRWTAIVAYPQPPAELTDDQHDSLADLPGYGFVTADGTHVRLGMTVEAATLRQATDAALRAAREAHTATFGTPGDPTEIRVLPEDIYQQEIAHPRTLDLLGTTEIGELLEVSRQRAAELADTHPEFPAAIGETSRGRVWTRDSIVKFEQRWNRKSGRPRKTTEE